MDDDFRICVPELGENDDWWTMDELRELSNSTGFKLVFITAAGEHWDEPQDAILEGKNGGTSVP